MRLMVNDRQVDTDLPEGAVALDLLRSSLGLKGTKEGCREGDCGACTILVGELVGGRVRYRPTCSCLLPVGLLAGRHVITIEGLSGGRPSAVQRAIIDNGATQCGFCTPGVVVSLTGFLLEAPVIDAAFAREWLAGNLCRCTGYASIGRACDAVAAAFRDLPPPGAARISRLIEAGAIPAFVDGIGARLARGADLDVPAAPPTEAILVGGGTDLFVQRPAELETAALRFAARRDTPRVVERDGVVSIDAAATVEDLASAAPFLGLAPGFDRFALQIASRQIRARATVGGNLANASPIGDLSIVFLALDATVVVAGPDGRRALPLRDLFVGYKRLALAKDEIIEALSVARPARPRRFNFEKVSRRAHTDIASVNSAAWLELRDDGLIAAASFSAGGVAPIPLHLRETSARVLGKPPGPETASLAAKIAREEVSPVSDVRGSAAYKRLLLGQLVLAHFAALFDSEEARP